jgi:hypothetical protein
MKLLRVGLIENQDKQNANKKESVGYGVIVPINEYETVQK